METTATAQYLRDLVLLRPEGEESAEALLTRSLPLVLGLAGARAVWVVELRHGAWEVRGHAGDQLEGDPPGPGEPAPDWAAAGIGTTTYRPWGDEHRQLVLAWDVASGPAPATAELETGLAALESTWGRRDAEGRLADLVARVDNAQALANMGDYDWHIASDTNRWSDQLYRIYGHEPQSFNASYERFLSLIFPEDRERITGIHQAAYASGEPYQMIERIVRPDGELRYLSSNGQVIHENGVPVRMRGTCIDITDRVLAEQERERSAERFRSLVESSPDAVLVLDDDGTVVQANTHATALLGGDPVGTRFDALVEATSSAQDVAGHGLDDRALRLDLVVAELPPTVGGGGERAVFVHDAGPRLEREALVARVREAQLRRRQALEINDNIVQGLTAALYSLDRGDGAAGEDYLARTLEAARRMMNDLLEPLDGGDLQPGDLVRSAPASLDLPADVPEPAPRAVADRGQGDPVRVLVVDDYDDVRMLLRIKLEQHGGYEVVGEAENGEEAVALAASLRPDLVLLDLAMPQMDGLQALPLIRKAVDGTRIIVLSGFDHGLMEAQALAAGADRYVEKGLGLRDLLEVVSGVLGSDRSADQDAERS